MTIAGIILAGGLARRMGGGDKALLQLSGRPLLQHVIDRLAPQVAEIAINANGDPARFGAFGLPVVADTVEGAERREEMERTFGPVEQVLLVLMRGPDVLRSAIRLPRPDPVGRR